MKYLDDETAIHEPLVAPFTGAWIEIISWAFPRQTSSVAPFTGAWIEIIMMKAPGGTAIVAPFTGAWIEI